ncbi:DUF2971 domain-containing protein [Poseidonibacter lekithochrous]|uniref:DUF2971 domain-containing protein n=1 Tax=Poseidonibacter lekithochrous TaxID=1904463 RepID=UPI0008FC4463|nr:DUF2971 domain-containing protein [Poseidonibacter lekithochrous]QKJ24135.1 DUF2971 domain-containing protein [Poseidonibacter lekithochrous]
MGNIIYHYCNVEAFRAIIQNKTLWLSSVYNLNDYKEIHWIKDKVLKKIEEVRTKDNFLIYEAFEKLYNNELPNVYIASFSQGNDLLSQWRAYANDGYGVAIGFNKDYFITNDLVHTTEVLYDETQQEKEIDTILKPLEKMNNDIQIYSNDFNTLCKDIITNINNLSAKSKNELFKEEQEVRLIHNPIIIDDKENEKFIFKKNLSDMKFRSVCGNLIPYFELKFDKEKKDIPAILEIVTGPKNKFINQEVKIFLSNNGFYSVDIKNSKSSYR